jgi:hypothetical protein
MFKLGLKWGVKLFIMQNTTTFSVIIDRQLSHPNAQGQTSMLRYCLFSCLLYWTHFSKSCLPFCTISCYFQRTSTLVILTLLLRLATAYQMAYCRKCRREFSQGLFLKMQGIPQNFDCYSRFIASYSLGCECQARGNHPQTRELLKMTTDH